jgi:hypothetical protein
MGSVASLDEVMPDLVKVVGGTWKRDRDGTYWEVSAGEFTLQAEPFLRQPKPSHRLIGFDCSVAQRSFGHLVNHIVGAPAKEFVSLRWFQHSSEVPTDTPLSERAERLMREALAIATSRPIEELIDEFAANRPDKPSIPQLCHLAALAWKGKVNTLLDYQQAFRAGKRLNFVPMVTVPMVDRALDEALKREP